MIQNIIFDLGVVLLEVDYEKTIQAFRQLGLENPLEAFSKYKQDDLFKRLEIGGISDRDFLSELSFRMNGIEPVRIEKAWCAMLGQLPKRKFQLLKQLKSRYRLFILSNTNSLHQRKFEEIIDEAFGWKHFESCFEYIGYSHQIGQRKPDRQSFEYLLDQFALKPEETLFIDDTEGHVQAANNLGIVGKHYEEGEDLGIILAQNPGPISF